MARGRTKRICGGLAAVADGAIPGTFKNERRRVVGGGVRRAVGSGGLFVEFYLSTPCVETVYQGSARCSSLSGSATGGECMLSPNSDAYE